MTAYRSVLLICEHDFWYPKGHRPLPGSIIYCVKCEAPSEVIRFDNERGTFYPEGEWTCYHKSLTQARGVCFNCGHEHIAPFKQLRIYMEKHHRSHCAWTGDTLQFELVNLPPNSPPPF